MPSDDSECDSLPGSQIILIHKQSVKFWHASAMVRKGGKEQEDGVLEGERAKRLASACSAYIRVHVDHVVPSELSEMEFRFPFCRFDQSCCQVKEETRE